MGSRSSNSSSGGPQKHGNFKKETRCSCPSSNEKVTKIEWISVPSMSSSASEALNAGRLILNKFFQGTLEIVLKGQNPDHDAVNAKIECSKCKHSCWYTIEYGEGGRVNRTGYYGNFTINGSYEIKKDMNMNDLMDIYNENSSDWTKEKYSLFDHNCKGFAIEKYAKIKNKY